MTELAQRFPQPGSLEERALKQAARELLLAQSSDWPFIMRTGTSPEYACQRLTDHLARFNALYEQLMSSQLELNTLKEFESQDNLFPEVNYHYWMA